MEISEVDPDHLVIASLLRDVGEPELERVGRTGLYLALQFYVGLLGTRALWLGCGMEGLVGSRVLIGRLHVQLKTLVWSPFAGTGTVNTIHSNASLCRLTHCQCLQ